MNSGYFSGLTHAGSEHLKLVQVGELEDGTAYLHNHVNIHIYYNPHDRGYRIVGFAVEPMSIAHEFQGGYDWDGESKEGWTKPLASCDPSVHMERTMIQKNQMVQPDAKVLFTYDVQWRESPVAWSSRWDIYLNEDHLVPAQVHWYSITNSILVVLFLSLSSFSN